MNEPIKETGNSRVHSESQVVCVKRDTESQQKYYNFQYFCFDAIKRSSFVEDGYLLSKSMINIH